MTRYQATELTDTGFGRRFTADRLSTVKDIVMALGGRWRIRRQWKEPVSWGDGKWHKDGGNRPEFVLSYNVR